jgi:hypothetical protein
MRELILGIAAAATVLPLANSTSGAFTARTRAEIVSRAVTLMPSSLQRQMRRHSRALYSGALEGMQECEGSGAHASGPGSAAQRLSDSVGRVTTMIGEQRTMREIVTELGRVSHATADLAFALNVGPDDPREAGFYAEFSQFIEDRLPRIRVTFDGFADQDLERHDVTAFAASVANRARLDYEGILRSYHPEGREATPQDFDDRSVAFAAASLEVSLAVTATARAWLYAWHSANGDLGGAPLYGTAGAGAPFTPADRAATGVDADGQSPRMEER